MCAHVAPGAELAECRETQEAQNHGGYRPCIVPMHLLSAPDLTEAAALVMVVVHLHLLTACVYHRLFIFVLGCVVADTECAADAGQTRPDPVRARRSGLRQSATSLPQGRPHPYVRHRTHAVATRPDNMDGDRPGCGRASVRLRRCQHLPDQGMCSGIPHTARVCSLSHSLCMSLSLSHALSLSRSPCSV